MPRSDLPTRTLLISAAGMAHAWGYQPDPISVLVESGGSGNVVLAAGRIAEVATHPAAAGSERVNFERHLLLPGLVNAHAHLDLTRIGPRPHRPEEGFVGFVDLVRSLRPTGEEEIEASVAEGVRLCRAGGTVAVGDIAGAPMGAPCVAALRAVAASGLAGVGFLEFFAIGTRSEVGVERVAGALEAAVACASESYRIGVQPHATNTVSLSAYRWAAGLDLPIATHLAESPEEREFIAKGDGPQRELLERLGIWMPAMLAEVGRGKSPVGHMEEVLAMRKMLVAHVNDCGNQDLAVLRRTATRVVYCPRASAYFGQERAFGPHRYREMLAAGIEVALGTDSVICLGRSDRISVLDEMRLLARRDGVDPRTLVTMATLHGARALGIGEERVGLRVGDRPLGVIAVEAAPAQGIRCDPLRAAMTSDAPPEWVVGGAAR